MTDVAPADQIAAVEDRHAREVLEAAACEIKVAPDSTDRGIRMHPGQDRVLELHSARDQPLTAPERPPTMRRSANRKKASAGIIESVVKARTPAVSALCSVE